MKRVVRGAILVLVWILAILEIAFFVGVGIACSGYYVFACKQVR